MYVPTETEKVTLLKMPKQLTTIWTSFWLLHCAFYIAY